MALDVAPQGPLVALTPTVTPALGWSGSPTSITLPSGAAAHLYVAGVRRTPGRPGLVICHGLGQAITDPAILGLVDVATARGFDVLVPTLPHGAGGWQAAPLVVAEAAAYLVALGCVNVGGFGYSLGCHALIAAAAADVDLFVRIACWHAAAPFDDYALFSTGGGVRSGIQTYTDNLGAAANAVPVAGMAPLFAYSGTADTTVDPSITAALVLAFTDAGVDALSIVGVGGTHGNRARREDASPPRGWSIGHPETDATATLLAWLAHVAAGSRA